MEDSSNGLSLFQNNEIGVEVRTIVINGNPHFVASDVAKSLGYKRPNDAIRQHCRGTVKHSIPDNQGIMQNYNLILEGDVYRLIIRSKLPSAEKFESWVMDEILPSIRKTGGYSIQESKIPQTFSEALRLAADKQEELEKAQLQIKQQAPKVLFAKAVETSKRSVLIGELAKIVTQNGFKIGQNNLFKWLRENGYLCTRGEKYNEPTQRAMEMGLFELKKTTITKPTGDIIVNTTTKVSGKGQIYFVNKFLLDSM